jgi:D-alanyl-lipoteichoic acid acyltransferase DltB (MBOAT superfamily)
MDLKKLSPRERLVENHPAELYSYLNYLSYVLYPPLYIAGPIMTFNDYVWQVWRPTCVKALRCTDLNEY